MRGNLLPSRIDLAIIIGIILYLLNLLVRFLYSKFIMKMTNYSALVFSLGDIHGAVTFTLAYTLDKNLISSNSFHLILFSEAVLIILTVIFQFILTKKIR